MADNTQAVEFEEWHPVEGIPTVLHLHSLTDNTDKICIELKCEDESKPHLKITVKDPMLYRNIYKKYRLSVWESTPSLEETTLVTFPNSETLVYLNYLNNDVYKDTLFVHYGIYTSHDCIDIISEHELNVEWME